MANIMRWGGADITEPFRRFLEGDMASWLRVEEYRDAGSMVVKAEVPGIDPEKDVDIELVGNDLRIQVRHEEKSEHKDKEGYRSEFRYGTFSRNVSLPGPVSESDIRATYDNGVLEVRIPLPDETGTASRKIPISRAGAVSGTGTGTTGSVGGTAESQA
ncbi:Hsp20/alpha crystallin family protein [Pseudarthrobacter equi]|uniref:Hsp20/alpha crystallin family protein n=1 Tax=Pseudarthrobacter TaxID=1742993 RepID=UPI001584928F|nr:MULTISPECIES: Hsp20/alpha crystallin family protein [Pseudarthrobacter]MCT9625974.1 Hsp20/alpha crystallin family protein [Pseudarthrobacter equi]NUT72174.1 Hsp20/alpha crystallin family protein [Pseudarthrobacter sp. C4D7]